MCVHSIIKKLLTLPSSLEIFLILTNFNRKRLALQILLHLPCCFKAFHALTAFFSLPLFSTLPPAFLSLLAAFSLSLSLSLSLSPFSLCCPVSCMLSRTLQKILAGMVKFCCCLSISLLFCLYGSHFTNTLQPPGKRVACVLVCGSMFICAFLRL